MMTDSNILIELAELRIGNYLLYDGKVVHVTMLSLDIDDEYEDNIGFCELGKTTNEKGGWNRELADKLRRIVITAEWLERLGFPADLSTMDAGGNYSLVFERREDKLFLIATSAMESEIVKEIQFVHEFQNLLHALKGKEVKI